MEASITDIPTQLYVDTNRRDQLKQLMEQHRSAQNFEFQEYRKDAFTKQDGVIGFRCP